MMPWYFPKGSTVAYASKPRSKEQQEARVTGDSLERDAHGMPSDSWHHITQENQALGHQAVKEDLDKEGRIGF